MNTVSSFLLCNIIEYQFPYTDKKYYISMQNNPQKRSRNKFRDGGLGFLQPTKHFSPDKIP